MRSQGSWTLSAEGGRTATTNDGEYHQNRVVLSSGTFLRGLPILGQPFGDARQPPSGPAALRAQESQVVFRCLASFITLYLTLPAHCDQTAAVTGDAVTPYMYA
jgi:hypothetical protein